MAYLRDWYHKKYLNNATHAQDSQTTHGTQDTQNMQNTQSTPGTQSTQGSQEFDTFQGPVPLVVVVEDFQCFDPAIIVDIVRIF